MKIFNKKVTLFILGLPKTLLFNFHYLPFKIAIRIPVWLTHKVKLKKINGQISILTTIKRGMISIGYQDVSISSLNEYSLWNVEGKVTFRGRARFGAGSKIAVGKNAELIFGDQFLITAKSEIACFRKIEFGEKCLLSWDILVMDTDAHSIYNQKNQKINEDKPIKIGNHVWIGCRSLILKGTEIPDGCVIGSQSVLNHKFKKSNCIIAGQPAKIVKENINWR